MSRGHVELVADASSLINILASTRAEDLVTLWGVTLVLTDIVDGEIKRNREVLEHLYSIGRARKESLPREALELFVVAAADVDDGEASAIALALFRGWPVLTDDARAQSIWRDMAPPGVGSARDTCGLLQEVAEQLGKIAIRDVLRAIESGARFRAPKAYAEWWARMLDEDKNS